MEGMSARVKPTRLFAKTRPPIVQRIFFCMQSAHNHCHQDWNPEANGCINCDPSPIKSLGHNGLPTAMKRHYFTTCQCFTDMFLPKLSCHVVTHNAHPCKGSHLEEVGDKT